MYRKLFAVFSFVTIYNLFFYKTGFGLGSFLLFILLHSFLFLLRNKESRYLKFSIFYAFLSIVFSFFVAFRSNEILLPINILASILTTSFAFFFYNLGSGFDYSLTQYLTIPLKSFVSLIEGIFRTPKLINTEKISKVKNSHTSALLRGALFAFPLVIFFILLFSMADPVYGKFSLDLFVAFQNAIVGPLWERLIISALLLLLSLGTLASLLKLKNEPEVGETNQEISKSKQIELITFLTLPVLVFLSFIIVQFEYLFYANSERQLAEIGIQSLTYSEYVKKGFFELLIVSAISLTLVSFLSRFVHRLKNKYETSLKLLISLLIVETQLILFSVVWRVIIYQLEHGLTRNRIFGMFLLIWLSLILCVYLAKTIMKLSAKKIFITVSTITAIILVSLSAVNTDLLIAEKFKPTVNERVDYRYISNLSFDASAQWTEIITQLDKSFFEISKKQTRSDDENYQLFCLHQSMTILQSKKRFLLEKYGVNVPDFSKNWQELNIAEYNAYVLIQNNKSQFEKVDQIAKDSLNIINEQLKVDKYTIFPNCGSI